MEYPGPSSPLAKRIWRHIQYDRLVLGFLRSEALKALSERNSVFGSMLVDVVRFDATLLVDCRGDLIAAKSVKWNQDHSNTATKISRSEWEEGLAVCSTAYDNELSIVMKSEVVDGLILKWSWCLVVEVGDTRRNDVLTIGWDGINSCDGRWSWCIIYVGGGSNASRSGGGRCSSRRGCRWSECIGRLGEELLRMGEALIIR